MHVYMEGVGAGLQQNWKAFPTNQPAWLVSIGCISVIYYVHAYVRVDRPHV